MRDSRVPGIQIQLLCGVNPKPEYDFTLLDYDSDDNDPEWPRQSVFVEAKTDEPIVLRTSFFPNFPHLNSCQAIKLVAMVDGHTLFTSRQRTEHIRHALHVNLQRSYDHTMQTVIRYEEGQRKTRVPKFVPLQLLDGPDAIVNDIGVIRIRAYRINWVEKRTPHRNPPVVRRAMATAEKQKRAPKNSKKHALERSKTVGRDAAAIKKLTHGVCLTNVVTTSQRAPLKTKVKPLRAPNDRVTEDEVKVSSGESYLDKDKGGKRSKPILEVLFHYRGTEKLREIGVDIPETPGSATISSEFMEGLYAAANMDMELTDEGYGTAPVPGSSSGQSGSTSRTVSYGTPLRFSSVISLG